MSKKMISFLGTSDYKECTYALDDKKVENVKYIQIALIKLLCLKFSIDDEIIILTTEKSKIKNWGDHDSGLYSELLSLNLQCTIRNIVIPEGKNQQEIWDIFKIIYDCINLEDKVFFDITHGFRSLPMLGLVLLNYCIVLKKIKVKGIFYGAYEAKNDNNEAPIFELSSFNELLKWSFAAEDFIKYGSSRKIEELLNIVTNNISDNNLINDYRDISSVLNDLTNIFSTVRGKKIISGDIFLDARKKINKVINKENPIPSLKPLLELIVEKIETFKEDDIENGLKAVEWCINHDLTQQGLTMLQETIITYIFENKKNEYLNEYCNIRNPDLTIRKELNIALQKINGADFFDSNQNICDITKKIPNIKDISKIYDNIRKLRNNINHGGYIKDEINIGEFKNGLIRFYNAIKQIFNR